MNIRFISVLSLALLTVLTGFAQNEKIEKEVFAGVSLNNYVGSETEGLKISTGFNVGAAGRYYWYRDFFAELSFGAKTQGYKSDLITSSGQFWDDGAANYDGEVKTTFRTYNLELPIMAGYRFNVSEDCNIKLKVGPYVGLALGGSLKQKGYITTYPDIHSSETERIDRSMCLADIYDFRNFEWGVQAGVAAEFKRFIVGASFQRSVVRQFNIDSFAQNINISVGYRF